MREIAGILTVVCLWLLFFVSSSEDKDGKTESKDEKGEFIQGCLPCCSASNAMDKWSLAYFFYIFVAAGSGAAASSSRNLWVSGLSSTTRATDLKTLFSKYGKVSILNRLRTCRSINLSWTHIFPSLLLFPAGCWC